MKTDPMTPDPPTKEATPSEQFTCECGFTWLRGQSGSHECGPGYRAKIERLECENAALVEALRLCDRRCDSLHHAKHHRHEIGEPCPVEAIIEAALKSASQKSASEEAR